MGIELNAPERSDLARSRKQVSISRSTAHEPRGSTTLFRNRFLSGGILLLLTIYSLKAASTVLIPLVLALLVSFLLASIMRQLSHLHIPAPLGAALILAVLLGTLGFGIFKLASPARDWMAKLPETARLVERKLTGIKQSVRDVSRATQEVERLATLNDQSRQKVEVRDVKLGESLLGSTWEFVAGAGLAFLLLFYLLAFGDVLLRKLVSVLPSYQDKRLAIEISQQIERDISSYLLAITIINAGFGVAIGICLLVLGLPNPVLWGVVAAALHFIPIAGAIVGISLVTMAAVTTLESPAAIALVPVSYLSLHLIQEYVLVPWVMGRRFLLNPFVVLLWLLFWATLWGVPGALMAVPLLAILKIVCDHIPRLSTVGEFLGP